MAIPPQLSRLFHTHINLPDFSIRDIFEVLIVWDILWVAIFYIVFRSLKDRYRWARRERSLLNALIEDVDSVSKSGEEIDKKSRPLWDSELISGLTLQLLQAEKAWLKDAKIVVSELDHCIETYQGLSKKREFLRMFLPNFLILGRISKFWIAKNQINNLFEEKEGNSIDIYGSLEMSRSKVRSLQDRPIEEHKSSTNSNKAVLLLPILKKLNELIDKNPDLKRGMEKQQRQIQSINLLVAFLKDLEGLRFESKTEMAWVKEAEEIIGKAQRHIQSILKTAKRMSWLLDFSNHMVKHQLKKSSNYIDTSLRELLQIKEAYDFKFIRRDPSKSIQQQEQMFPSHNSDQLTDDMGILSVVANIRSQVNAEVPALVSVELKLLASHFEHVHKLFTDAKAIEGIKNSRMAWSLEMKNIAGDADDSLKRYKQNYSAFQSRKLQKTDPSAQFSDEIDRFDHALKLLELSIKVCRIELRKETNLVVGLEEDIHEVVSRLTTNGKPMTLFIVGMKGIGKTTLTKMVYNHISIQNHFPFRFRVTLPDMVTADNVLKVLGNEVLSTNEEQNEKEYWIKKLREFFKEKKYLVVLDNISTKAVWDTLKEAFLESTNESRILLTTRYKSVAANSHADQSSSCHQLRLRTKDESWDLFEQMVHFPAESEQPSREVAEKVKALVCKVVGRCGGLPFSILRVGYLMSGKEVTVEELSRVLEHITHNQTPWSETLDINGKDLPLHLTQCLSYFGLFPRDSEIPARRLLALWVAEGLAQPIGGEQEESLESVAEKYLSELIDRNLVQVVERKLNGDVKTCGFPSALRELWLRRHNRTTPTSFLSSSLDHRLAYYFDENDASGSRNHGSSIHSPHILRSCRNPRSFLFFDTREGNKPGQDIGNFLHRGIASGHLLQLQVLDLERVFRPQLPKNIGKLIQLTYLGLRWTYLEDIPESIGNLLNLQTLDVEHTYIRTLPGSIWKLQKLRHLYMNEIYRSKIVHQPRWNFLRNLQTLQGAFVDKDSPLKDGLGNLSNLRKLALAIQLDLSQQNALAENIVKLTHLESLKLKSIDEMGRPQELKVKSLSTLKNISSLYLFGKLQHPFIIIDINGLPQNLTDLTLSASKLSDDPIPKLEKLQKLKSLCFYCDSYTGKKMVWSKGGFPQLLVLKFWMLQELEDWDVKEQAMPNLKQLEIRSCKRLKVPNGLKHLKSLRELKLKDMPVEFTTTIKETKEQIWHDIAHSLAIIN